MHIFTIIQLVLVGLLWIVKSTFVAIAFPLFVFLMIPLRLRIMPKFFTHDELEHVSIELNRVFLWYLLVKMAHQWNPSKLDPHPPLSIGHNFYFRGDSSLKKVIYRGLSRFGTTDHVLYREDYSIEDVQFREVTLYHVMLFVQFREVTLYRITMWCCLYPMHPLHITLP